jgi:2-(1,2-epoxy-1,2-dihydrophenyl)acetyl-CoA isomerase
VPEVESSRAGAVQTITLNRPEVLNAFSRAMHSALQAALKDAARDDEVRAVVVTGAGRGFCVGQDLTEFRDAPGDIADRLRAGYHPTIRALRSLEKPVLAAVNGPAAGAGLSLALACDIRVAADSASFVPAFISIGLVPDSGGTFFVRRLLGYARAFEWLATGRKLTAAEAHAWGLVSEVVEADKLAERTAELAGELAAMPTRAIGMTKRLLDCAALSSLEDQLELEAQLQAEAAQSEDFREGVNAFFEKREPRFTGS